MSQAAIVKGSAQVRRANAIRELAMLAGAVVIARASGPDTAHDVLAACRVCSKNAKP